MLDYSKIPESTLQSIKDYVDHGTPVGFFLAAVITNNLRDAIFGADDKNGPVLRQIVQYMHWEVPGECWGSPERYRDWINRHLKASTTVSA